jgi:hypothetical protein
LEEGIECIGLATGLVRVLLPDQRVGRDGKKPIAVGGRQRSKGHQRTDERRLQAKGIVAFQRARMRA